MSEYLQPDEFENPIEYDAYLASIFCKTINPKMDADFVKDCFIEFLALVYEPGVIVMPDAVEEFANQLMAGPVRAEEMH